ncbi:AbfB domain-containing protein [Streptomyces sp. NPDC046870]|uniref:AbfB domain-containing protein n=1 Tax=Streptomyces sp. NPDC046870 TaxID=3155135 RepID=UPI0034540DC1
MSTCHGQPVRNDWPRATGHRAGHGKSGTGTSFASYNYPTRYLRHYDHDLYMASNGGADAFDSSTSRTADVTWAVAAPWAP